MKKTINNGMGISRRHKYKFLLMLMVFLLACLLSACESIEFNIEETIKPPTTRNSVIEGTWEIKDYISFINGDSSGKINSRDYIGKRAIFDNELCAIGVDACINPEYKTIRIAAENYIRNKYRINSDIMGLQNKTVNVVTVTTKSNLFHELIISDEMKAYLYLDNGFLVLEKTSNLVDNNFKISSIANVKIDIENEEYEEDPLLRSSVFIGVRSTNNTYRTILLYSKNREIKAVCHREQLVVPRAKGFWEVGTKQNKNGDNAIVVRAFSEKEKQKLTTLTGESGIQIPKILFVGNDYIGTEQAYKFKVLPIDNISKKSGVTLSEIINDFSVSKISMAEEAFVKNLDSNRVNSVIREHSDSNYTLARRNGHWIMRSRLYFREAATASPEGKNYEDYDINIVVPSKLIHYDDMNIPWNEVKSKLPWATDAFMSPNKDIIILVTNESLYIYSIKNDKFINKQMMKIPLNKSDSIIMAEWAIGKYAEIWSDFAETFASGN